MLKARGTAHVFPGVGKLLDINSKKIVRKLTRGKGMPLFSPWQNPIGENVGRSTGLEIKANFRI